MHVGMRCLHGQPRAHGAREPPAPRVPEPAHPGPLPGPLRLVPVEQARFGRQRARAHGGDREGALEDLRQMVIDRVLEKRPSHRVVRAERREALAGGHREPGGAAAVAKDVGSEHQLVQVGVGMAAVDEPFAPVPGGELALRNGGALDIEHARETEPIEHAGMEEEHRLDHSHLTERASARHGVRPVERHNRQRSYPGPRSLLGRSGRRPPQGQPERDRQCQSDSATVARTGATAARR